MVILVSTRYCFGRVSAYPGQIEEVRLGLSANKTIAAAASGLSGK